MIAARRATPETYHAEMQKWYRTPSPAASTPRTVASGSLPGIPNVSARLSSLAASPRVAGLSRATFVVTRHASVRSVWFLNSLRSALALAAAVAIADLSGVQHGFWVVLGTLSVLRTSAASTGSTAWRALVGTAAGFVVGALLLIGIGTGQTALWIALPVAVLVAAYAPGTTPFAVGQAAFTVTIVVLFNLLVPAGWRVGLLRIEDVAIGCAVSLVVGVLFWPRGVSSVVGDDLADAFRRGADYLNQAVDWALSELLMPPAAALAAASAGIRLDDAVRGFLTEQGSKKVSKEDLWLLLNATTRLRLTANTLAGLRPSLPVPGAQPGTACLPLEGSDEYAGAPACTALRSAAGNLAGFYDQVADEVSHPPHAVAGPPLIPAPAMVGPAVPRELADGDSAGNGSAPPNGAPLASAGRQVVADTDGAAPGGATTAVETVNPAHQLPHPHLLWVQEHLHHLSQSAQMVSAPAQRLAEIRRRPWWR
jgi:uncharacterized membrane protein YccC